MTGVDHDRRFVRAPEVLWRQLHDVVLVRTVADSNVTELSGTGLLLWLALAEPATPGDIAAELAAVVGAAQDIVDRDVRTALADLISRGLVTSLEGV